MTIIVETGSDMVSLAGMSGKNTGEIKKTSAAGRMRRRRNRRAASRRSYSTSFYKNSGLFVY